MQAPTVTNYANPVYMSADLDLIDLEIATQEHGWIPTTIRMSDTDTQPHIVQIKTWLQENTGSIAAYVEPEIIPPTAEEIRDAAFMNLTHDLGEGRIIQIRPPATGKADESNIRNAIERMERLGITEQPWFMIDNIPRNVTVADLQEALESGQDQSAAIWATFFASL